MTTTYTGPTPYDAAIACYNVVQEGSQRLAHLRGLQQGWIVAKAEDAPLLEAAKAAHTILDGMLTPPNFKQPSLLELSNLRRQLKQALAAFEKGGQP